jgi:hypothetical protein
MIDGRPKKEGGRPKTAGDNDDEHQWSSFVRQLTMLASRVGGGRREEGTG